MDDEISRIIIPIYNVATTATMCCPTPAAIPIARVKNMKTISWVSLIAIRKRIMDMEPTSPNALARLFPITMITIVVIIAKATSEWTYEVE